MNVYENITYVDFERSYDVYVRVSVCELVIEWLKKR